MLLWELFGYNASETSKQLSNGSVALFDYFDG